MHAAPAWCLASVDLPQIISLLSWLAMVMSIATMRYPLALPVMAAKGIGRYDGTRLAKHRRTASSAADAGADANVAAPFDGSTMASSRLTIMDLPDDLLLQIFELARQPSFEDGCAEDLPDHSQPMARRWDCDTVWPLAETRDAVLPQDRRLRVGLQHSDSSAGVPALAQPADWGQPVVVLF